VTDNPAIERDQAGGQPGDSTEHVAQDPRQDAGRDKSIEKRLEKNPENEDAQLDRGLDESMDASDPPSAAQPGDKGEPPKSSGFDEAAEAERQQDS
jgi:hypothetical protein